MHILRRARIDGAAHETPSTTSDAIGSGEADRHVGARRWPAIGSKRALATAISCRARANIV